MLEMQVRCIRALERHLFWLLVAVVRLCMVQAAVRVKHLVRPQRATHTAGYEALSAIVSKGSETALNLR